MPLGDHELGEFIRRSLQAAAEPIVIGVDGLDRILARLAATRAADAAERAVGQALSCEEILALLSRRQGLDAGDHMR
jgi:hypothetical protein